MLAFNTGCGDDGDVALVQTSAPLCSKEGRRANKGNKIDQVVKHTNLHTSISIDIKSTFHRSMYSDRLGT